jgi:2-C-methyl-D-erythritol 2,4-cyclodiphosphate synthase
MFKTIYLVTLQAKTHEKVDSIGEERSIACHAVAMLIRKDLMAGN